ncbi:MAG: SDR family oxidoreductase [Candidatus Sumerlaeia bacterium]
MPTRGTALITGAAVRLGRAMALALAEDGFSIALHFSTSLAPAEQTAAQIRETGGVCSLFPCDFTDPAQVSALVSSVFERHPDCNVLINNASVFERAPLCETTDELLDRALAVNLRAPVILAREFARRAAPGSLVVNIADTKAARTVTEYFAYTLSKKALLAFTRMAARELGPAIRVNAIAPGLTLPPAGEDDTYLARMARRVPLQRPGSPGDIVAALRFIVAADSMTGQCLFMDSGEHLI